MKICAAIVMNAILILSNAYACDSLFDDQTRRAESIARDQLQNDINIELRKIDDGFCGAAGPSFIIDVKIRKIKKGVDAISGKIIVDERCDVIKSYVIMASGIDQRKLTDNTIMDVDACLE